MFLALSNHSSSIPFQTLISQKFYGFYHKIIIRIGSFLRLRAWFLTEWSNFDEILPAHPISISNYRCLCSLAIRAGPLVLRWPRNSLRQLSQLRTQPFDIWKCQCQIVQSLPDLFPNQFRTSWMQMSWHQPRDRSHWARIDLYSLLWHLISSNKPRQFVLYENLEVLYPAAVRGGQRVTKLRDESCKMPCN